MAKLNLESFITKFGGLTERYLFYNGEVELRYDPKDHVYLLVTPEGLIPQEGASSVGKIIDKSEALVPWACKMMALKLFKTVPIITMPDGSRILGHMSLDDFEKIVVTAKSAHREKLEDAGHVGHVAHAWIENVIKLALAQFGGICTPECLDMADPLPGDERARHCCNAALNWMSAHNVRWLSTERKIYSRTYRYAGTLDGLCYISSCGDPVCCPVPFVNRLSVADWKTSNQLYMEYVLQVSGYKHAYQEETGEAVQDCWIIRLGKEDGAFDPWHLQHESFAQDFDCFLKALELGRAVAAIRARMQGRDRLVKQGKRDAAKVEKDAALKVACKGSKTYKGVRAPQCNNGQPCETCLAIYAMAQEAKRLKLAAKNEAKKVAKREQNQNLPQ